MTYLKTTVNHGLPCIAKVTCYTPPEDSSYDSEGIDEEIEFDLYTRKGKLATWIEKAASAADLERVGNELIIQIKEMQHERSY